MDNITKPERVIVNAMKHVNSVDPDNVGGENYVPESMQPYVGNAVRNARSKMDILEKTLSLLPKSSDEYLQSQMDRENIAKSLHTMRKQIDLYNKGQIGFKGISTNINPGTKDENFYVNSAIYGNQWDTLGFDDNGKIHFGLSVDDNPKNLQYHKLDDLQDSNPIITKPFKSMKYVFDLYEVTKANKDMGKDFDWDWTYNSALTNFTNAGDDAIIGLAHADLAGDGRTKSFVEMYEAGLNDPLFYIHPETGEPLPKDAEWMKEPKNAEITNQLISRYIANSMGDVAGDIAMRGQVPEVEISADRELDNVSVTTTPSQKEAILLPEVTIEEDKNPELVADKELNDKVNKHIKKAEDLHEGIKTMPKKSFDYFIKRMRETVQSTRADKFLQDMINLRKATLTPAQLIKKYSK